MLLPCSCFRFTSRKLRVSPTSHRHYCATTVIMSSWLDGMSGGTVSARRPRLLGDVEVQLLPTLSASFGDTGKVGASHCVSQREPHLHGGVQGSASVHSCEQRRLSEERHYTEETADWCNHETRTSSVQQWIEHRPWVQLAQGPTKNLICAINEYKWKLLDLGLAGRARSRA